MISAIITASVLSSIAPPDYVDVHHFETDNWSGRFRVAYWEEFDKFRYGIRLDEDSQYSITYAEVFGSFVYDYEIDPGDWKSFTVFGNGLGYEETYAYLFSDYDGNFHNFTTIKPIEIPGPATLGIMGGLGFLMRRRKS
jgi:hypothetical protein